MNSIIMAQAGNEWKRLREYTLGNASVVERTLDTIRGMQGHLRSSTVYATRGVVEMTRRYVQNELPQLVEYLKFVRNNPRNRAAEHTPADTMYLKYPEAWNILMMPQERVQVVLADFDIFLGFFFTNDNDFNGTYWNHAPEQRLFEDLSSVDSAVFAALTRLSIYLSRLSPFLDHIHNAVNFFFSEGFVTQFILQRQIGPLAMAQHPRLAAGMPASWVGGDHLRLIADELRPKDYDAAVGAVLKFLQGM